MFEWEISYSIATYSGTETVFTDCDEQEVAIAKMWKQLERKCGGMGLPYGSRGARVISVREAA